MYEKKKWFAVYTKPHYEKRVTEILTRKKIENYCPINRVLRQWSDRKRLVNEPLFADFVFVKVQEGDLCSLKQIEGVINFVYWLGKPAVIRDSEIQAVRQFIDEYNNIQLEKIEVSVNGQDHTEDSPREHRSSLIAVKDKSVKVELPSLGYLMVAETETLNEGTLVRAITPRTRLSYFKYAFK
jgi:transcription antitermination factor NusG